MDGGNVSNWRNGPSKCDGSRETKDDHDCHAQKGITFVHDETDEWILAAGTASALKIPVQPFES
jgi:predicted NAD-dependent protein-ADP-ribosyltransferase YbiA (DUF1768 family)